MNYKEIITKYQNQLTKLEEEKEYLQHLLDEKKRYFITKVINSLRNEFPYSKYMLDSCNNTLDSCNKHILELFKNETKTEYNYVFKEDNIFIGIFIEPYEDKENIIKTVSKQISELYHSDTTIPE